jgi:lysine-specific demethylase 8
VDARVDLPGGGPTLRSVERVDGSGKRATVRGYLKRKQPVVFENMIDDWAAVGRWTPEWFAGTHGDRPINLFEFTHCYSIPSTMKEFVGWLDGQREGRLGKHEDLYLSWDFSVMKHRPELRRDFDFESLFPRGIGLVHSAFWMGGTGSHTPLHYDLDAPNLHACVAGRKRFLLFGPDQDEFLYPADIYEWTTQFSSVDVRSPDLARHPRIKNAVGYDIVLEPGDVLFLPGLWWHAAWCLTPCISLNGWWYGPGTVVAPRVLRETVRAGLHKVGLYARGRCTCCGHGDLRRLLQWADAPR